MKFHVRNRNKIAPPLGLELELSISVWYLVYGKDSLKEAHMQDKPKKRVC